MPRQIKEGVNLGHAEPLWTISDFYDVVARPNFSFLQHAEVESWSVMFHEQSRHPRFIHANADAVAGHTRLRHFKNCVTNAVAIPNADLVIGKPFNSEVFSELAEDEIFASKQTFPVLIGASLINKNGALLPTMTSQIALRIAIDIERPHHSSPLDWTFPNRGADNFPVPCHVAWKTDIY